MERRYQETHSEGMRSLIDKYMSEIPCPKCKGKRLNPTSLAVTVQDKNIIDLTDMSVKELLSFFSNMKLTETEQMIGEQILLRSTRV